MKNILVDINILIDLLNKRDDHVSAAKLFDACAIGIIKGFLCSHEITTLAYFLEKNKYPKEKGLVVISTLLDVFSIIPTTQENLKKALISNISDYEDAVIEMSGQSVDADYIVTRNGRDFRDGLLPCCNAREAIELLGI